MSRNRIALGTRASNKDEAPEWETVAYEFVCRYYNLLERTPDRLQCFYKEQSCFSFSRGIQGSPNIETRAVGQDLIHAELSKVLSTFKGQAVKVEISGFQCQGGFTNATGVLVHISGYIVPVATPLERQHFTQSFLLERQTEPRIGFFVLNDFLRYSPMSYQDGPMAMGPPMAQGNGQASAPQEIAKPYDDAEDEHEAKVSIELEDEENDTEAVQQELTSSVQAMEIQDQTHETGVEQDEEVEGAAEEEEDGDVAYREEPDEQERQAQEPKTWASMAGRLQSAGGGQLGPSKSVGFAAAPQRMAQASAATTPGATSKGATSGTSGKGGGGSSGSRAAAVSNNVAAEGTQHQQHQSGASSGGGRQWLWVSRLPTEPLAENQEVLDCFNSLLEACSSQGKALEVERRDPSQEWANLSVSSYEAADTLVSLSKSRQILLRGKALKAEHHRGRPGDRKPAFGRGSGSGRDFKGGAKGGGAAEGGGEDERSASAAGDGRGGARPKRRALRGDQGGGGQADQSGQAAGAAREQQHQPTRGFGGGGGAAAGAEGGSAGRASSGAYKAFSGAGK